MEPLIGARSSKKPHRLVLLSIAALSVVVLAVLILVVHAHNDLSALRNNQSASLETVEAISKAIGTHDSVPLVKKLDRIAGDLASVKYDIDGLTTSAYAAPFVPPRKYQWYRGTCWDFATIAMFEHQYRLQGIANGWLKENEYVSFSEQAYGNRILNLCAQFPDTCDTPGDRVAFNSTNGGEMHLIYEFRTALANQMLPVSVCPYLKDKDDSICPGIEDRLKKNPIRFSIKKAANLYDVPHVKEALRQSGHGLGVGTPVWSNAYYTPCTEATAEHADCKAETCQRCPDNLTPEAKCCIRTAATSFNMDAEFVRHHDISLTGGHAMLLAGYNDEYTTRNGNRGAFIFRNSWTDGLIEMGDEFKKTVRARASHSLAYFAGQISDTMERSICPNARNPRSWYMCSAVDECISERLAHTAELAFQPLKLVCRDEKKCVKEEGVFYYITSKKAAVDDQEKWCFIEVDERSQTNQTVCLDPMPVDLLAFVMEPVPAQDYKNKEDLCGYYAFPYDMVHDMWEKWGTFIVNDYHFEFDRSSYAANKKEFPQFEYKYIESSTFTQERVPSTLSPFPNPSPPNANSFRGAH